MRKLLLLLILGASALTAQVTFPNPVRSGPTLPATCSPGGLVPAWFLLTAGGPIATPYYCSAPNTWTAASGGGGGGGSPAGGAGAVQSELNSTTFTGDNTKVYQNLTALVAPAPGTITHGGTPGTADYEYCWAAVGKVGYSVCSISTVTMTSADPPTMTDTNIIPSTCGLLSAGTQVQAWLTAAGGSGNVGKIGSPVTCGSSLTDTTGFGDNTGAPSIDDTIGIFANNLTALNWLSAGTGVIVSPGPGQTEDAFAALTGNLDLINGAISQSYLAGDGADVSGIQSETEVTGAATNIRQMFGDVLIDSSGSVSSSVINLELQIFNNSPTPVPFAAILSISAGGTGTYTNLAGIDIGDLSGMASGLGVNIFSEGAASENIFNGQILLGSAATVNPFELTKNTSSATAPGAGLEAMRSVQGAGSTCNLVTNAGTSATELVIVMGVGGGC